MGPEKLGKKIDHLVIEAASKGMGVPEILPQLGASILTLLSLSNASNKIKINSIKGFCKLLIKHI